ncbi:MAG TPA: oxidative damage protection protein [Pseudomonadales bacterium]|nr:oxidative damage protection protein [Pseudomonadales bacterium]
MSRMVFCQRMQQTLEGFDRPPFPGPRGQFVYENLSKQAWQAWLKHQTLLINEKRLNLMDAQTQTYLNGEFDKWLKGEQVDQAEGYVPPSDEKKS